MTAVLETQIEFHENLFKFYAFFNFSFVLATEAGLISSDMSTPHAQIINHEINTQTHRSPGLRNSPIVQIICINLSLVKDTPVFSTGKHHIISQKHDSMSRA